jgi:hypothetical protein
MILTLIKACYAVRSIDHTRNTNTHINLLCILLFYCKIWNNFLGDSSNSGKIFILRKKIVSITVGAQSTASCRSLFQQLEIQAVPYQYMLSLVDFIISNQEYLQANLSMHNINTKNNYHFIDQMTTYLVFTKSTFYVGIKIVNS